MHMTIEHSHGGPAHRHEAGIGTPASSASVALDIGGGRGALSSIRASATADWRSRSARADGDGQRVHTGVHERSTDAGSMLTAIFGSLAGRSMGPLGGCGEQGETVTVPDGAVAEVRLD